MVNQAFDDPDIEEVITNVDTKPKNAKVRIFKLYHTATRHSTTPSTISKLECSQFGPYLTPNQQFYQRDKEETVVKVK